MTRIFRTSYGPDDWKNMLADPGKQWRSGYSARTAAFSWEAANPDLPKEIATLLGPDAELQLAIIEHKVPLPGGNRASQCDVFALARANKQDIALAVEAKVNDPFGPTIGKWLAIPSTGKTTRLNTICGWLDVPYPPPAELRYQLFHRTAAAVVEARRFHRAVAAMIVHSFSEQNRWIEDFQAFAGYLGLSVQVGEIAGKSLPCGTELQIGWAKGDPAFLSR